MSAIKNLFSLSLENITYQDVAILLLFAFALILTIILSLILISTKMNKINNDLISNHNEIMATEKNLKYYLHLLTKGNNVNEQFDNQIVNNSVIKNSLLDNADEKLQSDILNPIKLNIIESNKEALPSESELLTLYKNPQESNQESSNTPTQTSEDDDEQKNDTKSPEILEENVINTPVNKINLNQKTTRSTPRPGSITRPTSANNRPALQRVGTTPQRPTLGGNTGARPTTPANRPGTTPQRVGTTPQRPTLGGNTGARPTTPANRPAVTPQRAGTTPQRPALGGNTGARPTIPANRAGTTPQRVGTTPQRPALGGNTGARPTIPANRPGTTPQRVGTTPQRPTLGGNTGARPTIPANRPGTTPQRAGATAAVRRPLTPSR